MALENEYGFQSKNSYKKPTNTLIIELLQKLTITRNAKVGMALKKLQRV